MAQSTQGWAARTSEDRDMQVGLSQKHAGKPFSKARRKAFLKSTQVSLSQKHAGSLSQKHAGKPFSKARRRPFSKARR